MTLSAAPKFALQRTVRTTQPQSGSSINWGNPVTKNLNSVINMAEVKEVIFNRQLRRTTDYGAMLRTGPTPYGTGLVEVNSGGAALAPGRDLNYTTGHVALFSTFWLKNKSIATTTMVQLACNDIGTAWMSGAGSTGVCLYWTNELGVQKINAKLCWNAPYYINIDVTGIAEGLHTAAIVVKNLGAEIYLDGRKIGSATTANANYYTAGIALSGYENPTLYTSGIGMVLVRGSYIGPVTTGQMEELTSNPWQIFNPDKPLPPLSLAPHEVVTPRKSYMLGGSSPAPSTAAILTIPRRVRTTQPQGVVSVANGWCAYNAASQSLTGFGQTVSVPNTAPRATMGGICGGAVNVNFSPLKRLSIVEDTSSTFTLVGSFVRQDSGQHTFGFSSVTGYGFGLNLISTTYASAYGTWYGVQTVNDINSWTSYGSIINIAVSVQWVSKSVYNFYTQTLYVNGKYFSSTIGAGYPEAFTKFAATDTVLMAGICSGRLSDKQLLNLSLNPWQIFAPDNTPIWGPA